MTMSFSLWSCAVGLVVPSVWRAAAVRLVDHDAAFVPDVVLRVSLATIQLDCQPRLSTLVNGTYPGPTVYLAPEQTTWIRVYNDADVNTTMHWHGLSQSTAPFADGSPQASQWPIPPGRFFDYELHPSAYEAGTSFYHSHVGFQAVTASGVLIVQDATPPPYAYNDELILHIGDFYAADDHTVEAQLTGIPYRWTGDPQALLINGRSGTAPSSGANNATATASDASCRAAVLQVEPDRTYRVRVIGSTALSLVVFGVEGHDNLTVIETDHAYVWPVATPYIQVDTGQRFSFLLRTKSTAELQALGGRNAFWMQFETREGMDVVAAWAVLEYATTAASSQAEDDGQDPDPLALPSSSIPDGPIIDLPQNVTGWLEYTFTNPPLPGYETPPSAAEVSRRIIISTLQILNESSGHTVMTDNNRSWFDAAPLGPTTHTPYLVEILQHGQINGQRPSYERALAQGPAVGLDPGSQTYPARIGEVLEIVWQNAASYPGGIYGPHPMHAHGGSYWDMGSGPGVYSPETHGQLLQAHGTAGAPYPGSRRDTTLLYKYRLQAPTPGEVDGWRVWRVRVTERNVGVWMMHCHILQHMIMGQQTVWVFGTPEEIQANVQPVNGTLDGYFVYGGDVVGKTGQESKGVRMAQFFD